MNTRKKDKYAGVKHFFTYLDYAVKHNWQASALTDYDTGKEYSFGMMMERVEWLHCMMDSMGLRKGDRVVICGNNCANWAVTALAVTVSRGVIVSMMEAFAPRDIEGMVRHSEARMLFMGNNVWTKLDIDKMDKVEAVVSIEDFSLLYGLTESVTQGYSRTAERFAEAYSEGVSKENVCLPEIGLHELMMINYTSGSTAEPKGVMLTHGNISANVQYSQETIPNKAGWREICMLPLAHMFGFTIEFLYQICGGCHVYFLGRKPSPSILMKVYKEVRPYMILTVPLVVEKIVRGKVMPALERPVVRWLWRMPLANRLVGRKIRKELLKAFGGELQWLISGGAAINVDVERVMRKIRFPLVVGYGLTETEPLACYAHWWDEKVGCCGKVVSRCELRIASAKPNKDSGEVLIRGAHVMEGYYKNPSETARTIDDLGWFHTGDLGVLDKEGRLYIKGRIKTMILSSSGQNIYPEEIEAKLNNKPGVSESLVVKRGNKLVALVYADEGLAEADKRSVMDENLRCLNEEVANYEKIAAIELVDKEFDKTPKMSIKRYLYY